MVLLISFQIASVSLPNWLGVRATPGFSFINLFGGFVAVAVFVIVTLFGGRWLRAERPNVAEGLSRLSGRLACRRNFNASMLMAPKCDAAQLSRVPVPRNRNSLVREQAAA